MNKQEKVINGMECCIKRMTTTGECDYDCPYYHNPHGCKVVMLKDAISSMKAQEPRVMTYEEMMKAEVCFFEVKDIKEIYPYIRFEIYGKSYWTSPYTNNEENPFEQMATQEEYQKYARCWTQRPTDEQREAVKWDD